MFVIIHGDISDIDYVSVAGPFATEKEANAEGKRLELEGKLPNEDESGGEVAWRVSRLVGPADLTPDYSDEEG